MKLMIALAGVLAAVAVGGALALATGDDTSADTPGVDLTGPAPASASTSTEEGATTTTTTSRVDVSGPCDELENANDPRCTGAADDDDDRRNRGPGGGGGGDGESNSGPSGDSD
ncbi:MAG TPA: hypothetical protein VHF23_06170 [Gaiellaceae bacterium]|nr:hypothetical protein [Gaiellaceae bacterium]